MTNSLKACHQLELDSTMSQFWIEFWNWILNLTQNNLSQLFKSTVKIWAKLNIRNLVKNYPVLQVRSWICGGHGSWLVLKSFSLGYLSLLWKFELNWMSGCWEKFLWVVVVGGWHSRIVTLSPFDFWFLTWTWIVTIYICLTVIYPNLSMSNSSKI